jgi:uncharacterized protein (DUF1501 family)
MQPVRPTPRDLISQDGWLNRALLNGPAPNGPAGKPSAFRAVALGTQVPRTLQGKVDAVAVANLADFSVGGKGPQTSSISNAFQAMYDESTDSVLHGTGQETFEAVKMLKSANPAQYQPAAGIVYPNTPFGNSLKQIAQLMKANLGVEAAFSDIGASPSLPTGSLPSGKIWGLRRKILRSSPCPSSVGPHARMEPGAPITGMRTLCSSWAVR